MPATKKTNTTNTQNYIIIGLTILIIASALAFVIHNITNNEDSTEPVTTEEVLIEEAQPEVLEEEANPPAVDDTPVAPAPPEIELPETAPDAQ